MMRSVYTYLLILPGLIFFVRGKTESIQENDFVYPCATSKDVDACIKRYFIKSARGSCKNVSHEIGKPVFRKQREIYFSKANLTVICCDSDITFNDPKVKAFYLNKKTGNLVFALEFENVDTYTRHAHFLFHQVAKEPIVVTDYANGTYPCTLTAIIPVGDGLTKKAIRTASVTPYLPTDQPKFIIGSEIMKSTDPAIIQSLTGLMADLPGASLDMFLTAAPHFFVIYLQNYICDFGINVSTEYLGNAVDL